MPTYEVALAVRALEREATRAVLRRAGRALLARGGVLRALEALGARALPYKTSAHGAVHREASHFVYRAEVPARALRDLAEEFSRDVDVVRVRIYRAPDPRAAPAPCTLDAELRPPAYRQEVQHMIEVGKKQQNPFTYKFKYNSGLDYYPFQK